NCASPWANHTATRARKLQATDRNHGPHDEIAITDFAMRILSVEEQDLVVTAIACDAGRQLAQQVWAGLRKKIETRKRALLQPFVGIENGAELISVPSQFLAAAKQCPRRTSAQL